MIHRFDGCESTAYGHRVDVVSVDRKIQLEFRDVPTEALREATNRLAVATCVDPAVEGFVSSQHDRQTRIRAVHAHCGGGQRDN